jgi:protein TonB
MLRGIAVYSVQIGALVTVCMVAIRVLGVPYARTRLTIWRTVLAVCVLLPLWPARVNEVVVPAATSSARAGSMIAAMPQLQGMESQPLAAPSMISSWSAAALWLIAAGIVVRLMWLAAGLLTLRRLVAAAGQAVDAPELRALRALLAPEADVRWHDGVAQPVSFGLRRPVVLLPLSLLDRPAGIQRAALAHELLHIERGDWPAACLEQLVLACLWFHPAIWWAIDQIQLSREQTVDELTIAATGSRRTYLQTLLEFADARAVATASALVGRQLGARIRNLSKEIAMTRRRFVLTVSALTAVLTMLVWSIATALPLRATLRSVVLPAAVPPLAMASPVVPSVDAFNAAGSQVGTPSPTRTAAAAAPASLVAHLQRINRAAQELVAKQATQTAVAEVPARAVPAYPQDALKYGVGAVIVLNATVTRGGVVVDVTPAVWQLRLSREVQDAAYWISSPQKGFIDAATAAIRTWQFTPRGEETSLRATVEFDPNQPLVRATSQRRTQDGTLLEQSPVSSSTSLAAISTATGEPKPVRVGGDVPAPHPVRHVDPVYPPVAKEAGVQGIVIVEATVGTDGAVTNARILKSVPLLDQAALDAVRQWQYEPTRLNGVPAPVLMTVTVNFRITN